MTLHSKRQIAAAAMVLVALFGAACSGSDDTTTSDPAPTTSDPPPTEAPDPTDVPEPTAAPTAEPTATEVPVTELALLEDGPYAVGVATIEVVDDTRDRPLTVEVWFPVTNDGSLPAHQYTFLPGTYYESPTALTADAAMLDTEGGPYPLVMYSHGSGGLRYIHSSYTEAIASHGYIVMAPDHTGNTAVEDISGSSDPVEVVAANRPLDISAVIDAATDPTHPTAGPFAAHIDADSIAVTGHSFGGYTSYALAGGVTVGDQDIPADERVDALIALAPAVGEALLTDDRITAIEIPSMVIAGTDDKTTPIDPNVDRVWDLSPAMPHYRVELEAAEHQTFTNVCQYLDFLPTLEAPLEIVTATLEESGQAGCQPDDMEIERAVELTNTLAIGFLEEVFRGAEPLDPTALVLPDDLVVLAK